MLVKDVWKLADKDGGNAPEAASPSAASAAEGASTPEAAAQTTATEGIGTLTVGDKTVTLRHAYAFREPSRAISGKEDVRVVLSDVAITFVEQEDGFFVPEEAVSSSDEKEAGGPKRVEVTFDPEEKTQRFGLIYHGAPGADGVSVTSEFAPRAFDDQRIAGKLFMFGEGVIINEVKVHYTATFDAAIQRSTKKPPTSLEGADAAASSPGQVALAIARAMHAEDFQAIKPHVAEYYRRMFDAFQDTLIQDLFHLREQVTILSVTETGDEAVVVCEETDPNNIKFETILPMVREEGVWKLTRTTELN